MTEEVVYPGVFDDWKRDLAFALLALLIAGFVACS